MRKHLGTKVAVSLLSICSLYSIDAMAQRDRGRGQPSDQRPEQQGGDRSDRGDRGDRGSRRQENVQPGMQPRDRGPRQAPLGQPQQLPNWQQDRGRRPVSQPQSTPVQSNFPQRDRRPVTDQPAPNVQTPRGRERGQLNNDETRRINDRRQQQNPWGNRSDEGSRPIRDPRNNENNSRYQQIDRRQQEQLQRQRWDQYDQQWRNSQNIEKQRYRQLQEQRRNAYLRYQQRYWERLRRDRERLRQMRYYDNYYNNYRYYRGGNYYYTSQYGAQMLRDAVRNGYEEGFYAGQADRQDGWGFDYRNSYGYQDAAFGYDSYYVSMDEYNYYFREGFRRGYEDGYYSRSRYGNYSNGKYTILGAVIGAIIDIIAD